MTDLSSPVSRRTVRPHHKHGKRVVVTLLPGDVIAFRLERDRREPYLLDLHKLYTQAETRQALANASWHEQ